MKIYGLQKLTLLDFPSKTACTVFTGGCNLRCPFCHNAALVLLSPSAGDIPEEELWEFLKKRAGLLDGVCITGGEPLLQPDIADFMAGVKQLGYAVKLDTNGFYPDKLLRLIESGLVDYVAMDLKSSAGGYSAACGISEPDIAAVRRSIGLLMTGSVPYEFRTTVVKGIHTGELLAQAAHEIEGAERYYLQKFVDSGNLIGTGCEPFSDDEMREMLTIVKPFVKFAALRGVN